MEPNYDTILLYGVGSAGGNGSVGAGVGGVGVQVLCYMLSGRLLKCYKIKEKVYYDAQQA